MGSLVKNDSYVVVKMPGRKFLVAKKSIRPGWYLTMAVCENEHYANALLDELKIAEHHRNRVEQPNAEQA